MIAATASIRSSSSHHGVRSVVLSSSARPKSSATPGKRRRIGAGGTARALELDWTCERSLEDVRAQAFDEIDLLIGSDLIYPATSAIYKRLLRVLTTFSARRVLFAYPYKRDRAPANFFELARAESIRTVELHRDLEHEIAICELFLPNSAC